MKEIIEIVPHFIAIFMCTMFLNLCYAKLNDHKLIFAKKNILIMAITSILTAINNLYINYELKIIFSAIVICWNYKMIFKDEIKRVIVSFIIIYSIIILLEIAITDVLKILEVVTDSSSANFLTILKVFLSIIIGFLEYLLFLPNLLKKIFIKLQRIFLTNINVVNIIFLIFISISFIGILNIKNFVNNESMRLIFALIIIFATLFVLIIKSRVREELLEITNKKLIEYNDNYSRFLDEYKIYKHNINHKLAAMKTYGNKRINALIDDLLDEETAFSIKNNELYLIPNGIKGIVAEKLYDIDFDILIHNDLDYDPFINLAPKSFNSISECLGIALDNAIEASSETEEPLILMDLYENKENIYIKIGNNFCNDIDIDKLGEKYYSTKNRGSGLGLFSIMKNKNVKERISIVNNIYYIELKIKKAR